MTGILQTPAARLLSDQGEWKLWRPGDSKLLWISVSFPPVHVKSNPSTLILSYLPILHNLVRFKVCGKHVHIQYESFGSLMLT